MHVRNDVIERDAILAHEFGRQLRGAVDGTANIVAPVYAHFDSDGRSVSLAFVISMLSSLVSRQALVNGMIVHREMPGKESGAIVPASESLLHGERVTERVGPTRGIVRRMDRDKCRTHRPVQWTPTSVWGNDVLRDLQFGSTGRCEADHESNYKTKTRTVVHMLRMADEQGVGSSKHPTHALDPDLIDSVVSTASLSNLGSSRTGPHVGSV